MRRSHLTVLPLALLLLTSCEFFSNVVVPARDAVIPSAIASLYDFDAGQHIPTSSYTTNDPNRTLVALATIVDSGGAKRATMKPEVVAICSRGNLSLTISVLLSPLTATQTGTIGSTVKNGVFAFRVARLTEFMNLCQPHNATLDSLKFGWSVEGEDFHGNKAKIVRGELRYNHSLNS
jgi:hypothetical protein